MAAADTVAMLTAIVTGSSPSIPSTQEICDCGNSGCCGGGWPEQAYAYMTSKGNISATSSYPYWAQDNQNCSYVPADTIAGSVTGWERVPAYSMWALMKAVLAQPVLVYISATATDFQNYTSTPPGTPGFNIYSGSCSNEVNHAVVVVGFDYYGGYWIIKNTWLPTWGDHGYMYLAMVDGAGMCGMQTLSPLYPIYYPKAPQSAVVASGSYYPINQYYFGQWWVSYNQPSFNPCYGVVNPCGTGTCYASNNVARCYCPYGYVEWIGVPTSKCVSADPCGTAASNPCSIGKCTDVGDGSYVCSCPPGWVIGTRVDGAETCVPANSAPSSTYFTVAGDTCASVAAAYGLTLASFSSFNPTINCSYSFVAGMVVIVGRSNTTVACTQHYAIRQGDTCDLLAWAIQNPSFYAQLASYQTLKYVSPLYQFAPSNAGSPSRAALLAMNPTLNCNSLYLSQDICVNVSTSTAVTQAPPPCGQVYTTQPWDNCMNIMAGFGLNSTYFFTLNPGLGCNYNWGYLNPGIQVCVAPASQSTLNIVCTQKVTVYQGDSCDSIWNAANLSQAAFLYINPGLQCQAPYLYIGRKVCITSPNITFSSNFYTYTVQVRDTLQLIQAQFINKCLPTSVAPPVIAQYNNISNWYTYNLTVGQTLIIPCVARVGASCGCAPSIPVCGADYNTYQSYCDATCNFAQPSTNGACSSCQSWCANNVGVTAPSSVCGSNYVCPFPNYPPPTTAASQTFGNASHPVCSYAQQTCNNVCNAYSAAHGSGSYSACYTACNACNRISCGGPAQVVSPGSVYCPDCSAQGCNPDGRVCITDCTWWNSQWSPYMP
jgi:LysM repeat protein